jgi:hypothetical protein
MSSPKRSEKRYAASDRKPGQFDWMLGDAVWSKRSAGATRSLSLTSVPKNELGSEVRV